MSYQDNLRQVNDAITHYKTVPNVTLIGVTKTLSLEETETAIQAGIHNLGENRLQSAEIKIQKLNKKYDLNWHFIGNIQSKKLKKIVELFDVIQSVGSIEHLSLINKYCVDFGKRMKVLFQVNISKEESKHGFSKDELESTSINFDDYPNIDFLGYMTMAPYTGTDKELISIFKGLRTLAEDLKQTNGINYTELSMGMSNDYKYALQEGATIIRLGTILFS